MYESTQTHFAASLPRSHYLAMDAGTYLRVRNLSPAHSPRRPRLTFHSPSTPLDLPFKNFCLAQSLSKLSEMHTATARGFTSLRSRGVTKLHTAHAPWQLLHRCAANLPDPNTQQHVKNITAKSSVAALRCYDVGLRAQPCCHQSESSMVRTPRRGHSSVMACRRRGAKVRVLGCIF